MLQLNCEALGGYYGGRHPGYPHGGPIGPLGQRVGQADYSRRDTHGLLAAQDFMKLLMKLGYYLFFLVQRKYSCNRLGLLPCKPTRTPSCNPAPQVYKGSRGTSLDRTNSEPSSENNPSDTTPWRNTSH